MLQGIFERGWLLGCGRILVWLVEQIPPRGRYHQSARDLHNSQSDAEERQDFTAE